MFIATKLVTLCRYHSLMLSSCVWWCCVAEDTEADYDIGGSDNEDDKEDADSK